MILRPDTMTLFANASWIRDEINACVADAQRPLEVVVLDLEASDELDITVVETLASLKRDLAFKGIELWLARVRTDARALLDRARQADIVGPERVFDTVGQAVAAFDERLSERA